jgi:hypothetical protein
MSDEKLTAEEKLSKVLDIEILPKEEPKTIVQSEIFIKEVKIKRKDQVRQDYDSARKNMKELINRGFEALDGVMRVAEAGDSPRAYEVVSQMIKTLVDANKDLINLRKQLKDIDQTAIGDTNIQNNLFVGNTAELQRLINNRNKSLI